jgi:hypothetical protein
VSAILLSRKLLLIQCSSSIDFAQPQHSPGSFIKGKRIGEAPLAEIVFEYRSRDILEADGIIRQPSNTLPPPSTGPLTPPPTTKRERPSDEDNEALIKRYKGERVRGVLTFDLTEDDA